MKTRSNVGALAMTAVMIAIVAVATGFLPKVPIPGTGGYVHLGDIFVFFAAFAFGPIVGAVAGGIGCALADILGGYAVWAPLTVVAHGLEGLVAGYLAYRLYHGKGIWGLIVAWAGGAICLVSLYFLGELLPVYGGLAGAVTEVVANIMQAAAGGIAGIPLYLFVRRAYPPIEQIARPHAWREG